MLKKLLRKYFQVLSASGGQIIAVQNPALSLSGALLRSSSSSVTSSHLHHDVTVSSHHDVTTRQSNITSSTPLSTLLNLSRRDESNGNGNEYYNNEVTSRGAGNHLRELRSSRAMMAMTSSMGINSEPNHSSSSSNNFVFKEEPVSPPRSSSTPTLAPSLLKD